MLPFEEALDRALALVKPLGAERVPLPAASGRVLATTLVARDPIPAFDYSAMDGYAVAAATLDSSPVSLPVKGESKTGAEPPDLEPGSTCRIFTGARLPAGADAVVMQEDVERDGDVARFARGANVGQHVRRAGEDLAPGATALEAGVALGPFQLGLVASLDIANVVVSRRPRVTILCTGDELRSPGDPPFAGSIPESNGICLASMVQASGGEALLAPLTGDDARATAGAVRAALHGADLLVTVGGVSVGEYDVVRPALEAAGATLDFWKVRIKPGKPLVLGRAGDTVLLGVPGNPVSAQVTFALFGAPMLRKMQGATKIRPTPGRARLSAPIRQKPGRIGFYRGKLNGDGVEPLENQASGAPTSMAWADALIIVPEESPGYETGASVEILRLAEL